MNQYSRGKLNEDDQGDMLLAVGTDQNRVILEFSKSVAWIGFDKAGALKLADSIRAAANGLEDVH